MGQTESAGERPPRGVDKGPLCCYFDGGAFSQLVRPHDTIPELHKGDYSISGFVRLDPSMAPELREEHLYDILQKGSLVDNCQPGLFLSPASKGNKLIVVVTSRNADDRAEVVQNHLMSEAEVPVDHWFHFCVTSRTTRLEEFRVTTVTLYINGDYEAEMQLAGDPIYDNGELFIGHSFNFALRGCIGTLKFFTTALKHSAVDELARWNPLPRGGTPNIVCLSDRQGMGVWDEYWCTPVPGEMMFEFEVRVADGAIIYLAAELPIAQTATLAEGQKPEEEEGGEDGGGAPPTGPQLQETKPDLNPSLQASGGPNGPEGDQAPETSGLTEDDLLWTPPHDVISIGLGFKGDDYDETEHMYSVIQHHTDSGASDLVRVDSSSTRRRWEASFADMTRFYKVWIRATKAGVIKVGRGPVQSTPIMECKDSPVKNIRFVGVSCNYSAAEFRNLRITDQRGRRVKVPIMGDMTITPGDGAGCVTCLGGGQSDAPAQGPIMARKSSIA